jgi:predicted amidohydrolase YtcJ
MAWAEERIGKRVKNAYAYQRLLQQNGWVVNGTDFPIEHISPLYTFYAAVSRQNLEGQPVGGWQPEDSLTRQQALRSITCWVAKGYFEEDRKGSIEKGKEADFVILEQDIMVIPLKEIPSTGIRRLFISGSEIPVK